MKPIQVTILGYNSYKFEDDKGKEVSGTAVHFVEQTPQNDDYGHGFVPRKATMPYEFQDELRGIKFPYLAEPQLVTRFGAKGAKAVIEDFDLISPAKFVIENLAVTK